MKRNAWDEIGSWLGIAPVTARTRYDNIHTAFVKSVRGRSGAGRDDVPPLRSEQEHLGWLIAHIKHRRSSTNFKSQRPRQTDKDSVKEQTENNDSSISDGQDIENLGLQDNRISDIISESQPDVRDMNSPPSPSQIDSDEEQSVHGDKGNDTSNIGNIDLLTSSASSTFGPTKETPKSLKPASSGSYSGRKRSWPKVSKPVAATDVDREFIKTVTSLQKAIFSSSNKPEQEIEPFDEDRHFCLTLVGQFKNLEPRYKSMAKLQIIQVMNDIEWMRSAPQAQQVPHQFGGQFRQMVPRTEYTTGDSTPLQNQPFNQPHPSTQLSRGVY